MYWLALGQIVGGLLLYQVSQKVVPKTSNPFWFVALSYGIGMAICLFLAMVIPRAWSHGGGPGASSTPTATFDGKLLVCSLGMGLGATLIEIGYFLGYRNGWAISELPVFVMVSAAICLAVIGAVWFREEISMPRVIGLASCCGGLYLMLRK